MPQQAAIKSERVFLHRMPDTESAFLKRRRQIRDAKRGKWDHIVVAPKGTTLKSDPGARSDLRALIDDKSSLHILYPKGGLERKEAARTVRKLRKIASQFPMQK